MTYNLPHKVELPPEWDKKATDKYARMAIYIDINIYKPEDERDVETLYKYIYHIAYMLSCKAKMFSGPGASRDYDDFALYVAARVYTRLTNPRQFDVDDGQRQLKEIKSSLNYIKFVLHKLKVRWQEENFNQIFSDKHGFDTNDMTNKYKDSIQSDYEEGLPEAVQYELSFINSITYKCVEESPYSSNPIIKQRIYISCLLSLLNNFTLSNKVKEKIKQKEEKCDSSSSDDYKIKSLNKESEDCIILWRLDNSFKDYIDIIIKKVKHRLVQNITDTTKSFELPDDTLQQIMMSGWSEYIVHNEEED